MKLIDRLLMRNKRRTPFSAHRSWNNMGEGSFPTTFLVQDYLDEDGRRHRADAPYLLPKDMQEIQRIDFQHFIFRQALKGNIFAPVETLLTHGKALDVGCGTGRWGKEIATACPTCQVYGLDLEDVPHPSSEPLNYHFYQGNLLHGLPFTAQSFEYVHQRLLVAAIPANKWPWVVGELKRVTCVGGWLELVEMGNTFHRAGPATQRFLEWWIAIGASRGIDASKMSRLDTLLHGAGLNAIHTQTFLLPVGEWGGRLGSLLAQDMLAGWPTMRPLAHQLLGVQPETFDAVIAALACEWNQYQTRYEVYAACGQVPQTTQGNATKRNG